MHKKLLEVIAQHITEAYDGDNWTEVNVKQTLHDVTLEEATTKTQASTNTIASLLFHMQYYNNIILERLKGVKTKANASNGYDMPVLKTEDEWKQLQQQTIASAYSMAALIKNVTEEKIFAPIITGYTSTYKQLHGIVEHAYYHLGQIVILKKLIRSSY